MTDRLSIYIVTGFLGSGKTTLIKKFLQATSEFETGLVVSEFGEIGVDHRLLEVASDEVELIDGGKTHRSEIAPALYNLVAKSKATSKSKRIKRAIIETSGMSDPGPIIGVIHNDAWLRANVTISAIVTVVDAVSGIDDLQEFDQARSQVSMADRIVVTKTDLRAASSYQQVCEAIRLHSPDAIVSDGFDPSFDFSEVLKDQDARANFDMIPLDPINHGRNEPTANSFVISLKEQVDWPVFTIWLSALLHEHGDRILRVKGLLRTSSSAEPLAVHGVQRVMYPPIHLKRRDDTDEPSFLVFITRNINRTSIENSLRLFLSLGIEMSKQASAK